MKGSMAPTRTTWTSRNNWCLASLTSHLRAIILHLFLVAIYSSAAYSIDGRAPSLEQRNARGLSSYQTVVMGSQLMAQRNNLRGNPGNGYSIDIDIGTEKQRLNVLVDTGSSNFAIAAAPDPMVSTYFKYDDSSTYTPLNRDIDVGYTVGSWSGVLGRDKVSLPAGPDVSFTANLAGILESDNFYINGSFWQGILGLGYADIAMPDSSITPFFDSLVTQTDIPNIFTIQLCGINYTLTDSNDRLFTTGTLTIGGIDKELYDGKITYTPLRREWYYEVIITDMKINNKSLGMDCKEYNNDRTIVDSGTTRLRLPSNVFEEVVTTLKREVNLAADLVPEGFWSGLLTICKDKVLNGTEMWEHFPSLTVTLQGEAVGEEFDLLITPKQYLKLNDTADGGCYKLGIARSFSGTVLGVTLMEGYYVVFDRQNTRIGFAQSRCAKTQCLDGPACNLRAPAILGPFKSGAVDCAFDRSGGSSHAMEIAGYIMLALCVLCFSPILVMYLHLKIKQHCFSDDGYSRQHNEASTEMGDDP